MFDCQKTTTAETPSMLLYTTEIAVEYFPNKNIDCGIGLASGSRQQRS